MNIINNNYYQKTYIIDGNQHVCCLLWSHAVVFSDFDQAGSAMQEPKMIAYVGLQRQQLGSMEDISIVTLW